MPFVCPHCASGTLEVLGSLELPPDRWWDEIALHALGCPRCGFGGLAVYEESRRGGLDSESTNYQGHRVPEVAVAELLEGIAACPAPRDPTCPCTAHGRWGRADTSGRWLGVAESLEAFPLRRA